jgi:hypothetical protein
MPDLRRYFPAGCGMVKATEPFLNSSTPMTFEIGYAEDGSPGGAVIFADAGGPTPIHSTRVGTDLNPAVTKSCPFSADRTLPNQKSFRSVMCPNRKTIIRLQCGSCRVLHPPLIG